MLTQLLYLAQCLIIKQSYLSTRQLNKDQQIRQSLLTAILGDPQCTADH